MDAALDPHRRIVEDYNREDCVAARGLRDWLERLRAAAIADGAELPRPRRPEADASAQVGELDARLHALRDALLEGVAADAAERDAEKQARLALANMKATWWEYFRVLDLEAQDYASERRAIAGLEFVEFVEATRAPLQRYRFPPPAATWSWRRRCKCRGAPRTARCRQRCPAPADGAVTADVATARRNPRRVAPGPACWRAREFVR